jgi:hypothetical protein
LNPGREAPADALRALAGQLRDERSVISDWVRDPGEEPPTLGALAAAGPRSGEAAAEYALLVEAIREGYLLHYAEPRVLDGLDPDLALLAGDYLYALGLERLAALGDLEAVRELSDLISLCAQLHAEARAPGLIEPLWLASAVAVACGADCGHEQGKRALRDGRSGAGDALLATARGRAAEAGLGDELERAAERIDFPAPRA